jgi:hypothetical protein
MNLLRLSLEFTRNRIARAEFRHQRHVIKTSRSGTLWIVLAVVMLLPGLLMSLVLFATTLVDRPPYFTQEPLRLFVGYTETTGDYVAMIGVAAMVTMNVALYLVVILITLGLSANSVAREKLNRTWDVLLLTNVDAREMVRGKWWASLKALNGDHAMIGILRLGLVGFLIGVFASKLPQTPHGLPTGITYVLPLALVVIAFTAIDAAFTAALGIAGALSDFPGAVTAALIFTVRAFGIALAVAFFWTVIEMMFDGGPYLLVALGGLGLFVLMTWLTLLMAQKVAVWGQVSPSA